MCACLLPPRSLRLCPLCTVYAHYPPPVSHYGVVAPVLFPWCCGSLLHRSMISYTVSKDQGEVHQRSTAKKNAAGYISDSICPLESLEGRAAAWHLSHQRLLGRLSSESV